MENAKTSIKKNKTFKKILCYFSLVVLTILLFIPALFRLIFKEEKPTVKEDVVSILNCEKSEESVRSTFLNDTPKNILYKIKGNYETITDEEEETMSLNPVYKKLINYGQPVYDEANGISTIQFNTSVTENSIDYELIFSKLVNQEEYFRSQGFSCSVIKQ